MPRPTSFSPRRARGFSLIEMVAAFLVFAIAVGVQMQILATSLHTTRRSAEYTQAALWAQSRLDVVGVGERIEEGDSSGRFDDRYSWELRIHKVDPQGIVPPQALGGGIAGLAAGQQVAAADQVGNSGALSASPVEIYQLDLTVIWGTRNNPRSETFSTLRATNPDDGSGLSGGGGVNMPSMRNQAPGANSATATSRAGGTKR